MKKVVKFIGLLLVMMMALALVGCGGTEKPAATEDPGAAAETAGGGQIKIAVAAPLTGDNSEYGIGFYNAVSMMAESWNEKGGIHNNKIAVV